MKRQSIIVGVVVPFLFISASTSFGNIASFKPEMVEFVTIQMVIVY